MRLGSIHSMFLPCILKPFPLQGTDKSFPSDQKNDPAAAGCVCEPSAKT